MLIVNKFSFVETVLEDVIILICKIFYYLIKIRDLNI
jgi:hypothetical protein